MKVLLIAFDSGEYTVRLAAALADHVEVILMLPHSQANPNKRWLSPAVQLEPFEKPRLREPLAQMRLMRRLVRRIKVLSPDVIHFQKSHLWFNMVLPRLRKYPLVVSIHDPRDHIGDASSRRTPQFIKDFGYRQATRLLAHSQAMVPQIMTRFGVARSDIDVVPLLPMGDTAEASDVDEVGQHVLFFGRIWGYKGLAYLIKAAPLIQAEIPDVHFVIAGRGEDLTSYRQLMHDSSRFTFFNEFVPLDRQARLFREASVIVLPYTEATQSGVIPVAYNFSRPVVATAVGGLLDQVDDGRTGLLVPPKDERALAQAVVTLLQDPPLRRRMGRAGREKLDTEWSPTVIALRSVEVYRRTIRAHHSNRHKPLPSGQETA